MLHLRTLGDLELFEDVDSAVPLLRGVKPLLIPAVLATLPAHEGARDYLSGLIWPGADRDRARSSLRQALHHLSKYAKGGGVEVLDGILRLDEGKISVDLWAFEEAVRDGDSAAAVSLYGGVFLQTAQRFAGRELTQWIEAEDIKTSAALSAAYTDLVQERLRDGAVQDALRHAQAFARMNPLSESAQLTLIRTLRAVGDQLAALQAYEAYQSLLMSELDAELPPDAKAGLERLRQEAIQEPSRTSVVYVASQKGEGDNGDYFRISKRVAWGAVGAVVAFAALGLGWLATSTSGGEGEAITVGASLTDGRLVDVEIRRDGTLVHARPFGAVEAPQVVSPDRTKRVQAVPGVGGRDLVLEELATGDKRILVSTLGDEVPMSWSPDGRLVLYRSGDMSADSTSFRVSFWIVDVSTRERRAVGDLSSSSENVAGAWSPRGTRLAIVLSDGNAQPGVAASVLVFTRPDGTGTRYVALDHRRLGQPGWSPDGKRVVFSAGQAGAQDLYVVGVDDVEVRRLTDTPGTETTPVWMSQNTIAYLFESGEGGRELRFIDLDSGETRRIGSAGEISGLRSQEVIRDDARWIDSLAIVDFPRPVSPGQLLFLEASASDSRGRPVAVEGLPLVWSSTDTTVVRPLEGGWFQVVRAGSVELEVALRGWRRRVIPVRSTELQEADVPLLFQEDWARGLPSEVWTQYGSPAPTTYLTGGVSGTGSLAANGDGSFTSGVVSVTEFPFRDGLTLEVWGKAPFTNQHWQDLLFGFEEDTPPVDSLVSAWVRDRHRFPDVNVSAYDGGLGGNYLRPEGTRLPIPHDPAEWHRYALQVAPDGTVSLVLDGVLYWRQRYPGPWDPGLSTHIHLGSASVNTDIRHGLVRLWRGERYVVPGGS